MWKILLIPFFAQAIAIILDEGIFHVKRGLPLWERIGHPIDTLSVLICIVYAVLLPFTMFHLKVYIGLAVFSCLLVTKDEFVHKHFCPASENWLHAILFTLHPITLICVGCMWPVISGVDVPIWMSRVLDDPGALKTILYGQGVAMTLFLFYQIIFWGIIWRNKPVMKH